MKTKFIASSFALFLAACASSSSNDAAIGANAQAVAAAKAAEPADLTGTWGFALESSDVAAPLRDRCKKAGADDDAKARACWNEVAAEAAKEKIRFTKGAGGAVVWTSFGSEGTKEIVFVEVPVELTNDGPGHVLAKVTGAPKGEMAAQFAKSSTNVMRIELVDARTIAVTDTKKGRLVYTKE